MSHLGSRRGSTGGDGSGLTDGIEFDLRQENRLTTKLVLRPKGTSAATVGSHKIKVLATAGSEAQVGIYTLNVETVFKPPYDGSYANEDAGGGKIHTWGNKNTGGFVVEATAMASFRAQKPAGGVRYFVSFTATQSGEVTIEAPIDYVKFLWGSVTNGGYSGGIFVTLDVNGVRYPYPIAGCGGGSVDLDLDMPTDLSRIDALKKLVDGIIDLVEAMMSAREFTKEMEEYSGQFKTFKTYVVRQPIQVQAGQIYHIGVGVSVDAWAQATMGGGGVEAKITGFVRNIKIRW